MRLVIIFLLLMSFQLEAQDFGPIKFDKLTHDFGAFPMGEKHTTTFKYTNTADTAFLITRMEPSCGCTTPDFDASLIAPGETRTLTIEYNSENRPGPFTKSITVYSSMWDNVLFLTISGDATTPPPTLIDLYPYAIKEKYLIKNTHVFFGNVGVKGISEQSVLMGNGLLDSSIKILNIVPPKYISASLKEFTIPAQQEKNITFKLDGSKLNAWGYVRDSIGVVTPDTTFYLTLSLLRKDIFTVEENNDPKAPRFKVDQHLLKLNGESIKSKPTLKFKITNDGEKPLLIRSVEPSSTNIKVNLPKYKIAPGETIILSITIIDGKIGMNNYSVTIFNNSPANPLAAVAIQGMLSE